jgi:hypothetical protein
MQPSVQNVRWIKELTGRGENQNQLSVRYAETVKRQKMRVREKVQAGDKAQAVA